jgi:hypothetical protein
MNLADSVIVENLVGKFGWSEKRQLPCKRQTHDDVQIQLFQNPVFLVLGLKQKRGVVGGNDLLRVRGKGQENRCPLPFLRSLHHLAQDNLMSSMDSIEDSDGHHRIVQGLREVGKIIDDLHITQSISSI